MEPQYQMGLASTTGGVPKAPLWSTASLDVELQTKSLTEGLSLSSFCCLK